MEERKQLHNYEEVITEFCWYPSYCWVSLSFKAEAENPYIGKYIVVNTSVHMENISRFFNILFD